MEPRTKGRAHRTRGARVLHCAAAGLTGELAALLARGASANGRVPPGGDTPLFAASSCGHAAAVATLLAAGADPDRPTSAGGTPLFAAAARNRRAAAARLLAAGASVDALLGPSRVTALCAACLHGHLGAVEQLLAARAGVDVPKGSGSTPLYLASKEGHADVVSSLLAAGAAVDAAKPSGATALYIACERGHRGAVRLLVAAGASVSRPLHDQSATPLYIASQNGHPGVVEVLLAARAQVDSARLPDLATPLHIASDDGNADVVAALLVAGADPDRPDCDGATPFRRAVVFGHLPVVQLLSSYGARRRPRDTQRARALGHERLAAWLDASVVWITPLHHVSVLSEARVRALLRAGADLRARAAHRTAPSAVDVARALCAAADPAGGSPAARLVVAAAGPWSPQTHALFPAAARARAVGLLLVGASLARRPGLAGQGGSLWDAWLAVVLPLAVRREQWF